MKYYYRESGTIGWFECSKTMYEYALDSAMLEARKTDINQ